MQELLNWCNQNIICIQSEQAQLLRFNESKLLLIDRCSRHASTASPSIQPLMWLLISYIFARHHTKGFNIHVWCSRSSYFHQPNTDRMKLVNFQMALFLSQDLHDLLLFQKIEKKYTTQHMPLHNISQKPY